MTTAFELLPAIDLRGGRVVRLRAGRLRRARPRTTTTRSPSRGGSRRPGADLAPRRRPRRCAGRGAAPAARSPRRSSPRRSGRARVELGGGLRTAEAVAGALGTGAARAAVGTAALRDPAFAARARRRATARTGSSASIDVRDGLAARRGLASGRARACRRPTPIAMLAAAGVDTFEVTAIERDGLLEGPTSTLLRALVALEPGPDHRLGRRRIDRRRARGPGGRLRRRDRRPGALRGPYRPAASSRAGRRGPRSVG